MNTATRSRHQRFCDLIHQPAGLPDIENHLNIAACQFDVAHHRLEDVIAGGQQLQLIPFDTRNALTTLAQLE